MLQCYWKAQQKDARQEVEAPTGQVPKPEGGQGTMSILAQPQQYTSIDRYQQSYANGVQKFFDGLSATYCANDAELGGFLAAANQIATEHEQGVWDEELEALRARDLEVDEAQSGYADWR